MVIKFQRQLGYDPSVSQLSFLVSVSGLQGPGSLLGIILHCPLSQTSESGVTDCHGRNLLTFGTTEAVNQVTSDS